MSKVRFATCLRRSHASKAVLYKKFQITAANDAITATGKDSAASLSLSFINTKVEEMIAIISKIITYVRRRLSGDKVINQDSKALERKQKSAYQSIGPSRDRKEKKAQSHGFRLHFYYT